MHINTSLAVALSLLSSQITCHLMLLHLAFLLNKLFCRSLHICREKSSPFPLIAQQFEASLRSLTYIKEVGTVTHQAPFDYLWLIHCKFQFGIIYPLPPPSITWHTQGARTIPTLDHPLGLTSRLWARTTQGWRL